MFAKVAFVFLFDNVTEDGIEVLGGTKSKRPTSGPALSSSALQKALEPVTKLQQTNNDKIAAVQGQLLVLQRRLPEKGDELGPFGMNRDVFLVAVILVFQLILFWLFK